MMKQTTKLATVPENCEMYQLAHPSQSANATQGFLPYDTSSQTVHTCTNAKAEAVPIVASPLLAVEVIASDNNSELPAMLTEASKRALKSLAPVFEWDEEPVDKFSIWNGADPENFDHHAQWLKEQEGFHSRRSTKASGIDVSSSAEEWGSKMPRSKECLYWPLGTCRNGGECLFYHDPAKAYKPGTAKSNVCWFWNKGKCSKSAADCPYDHFE
jgi:hypothetical protein